MIKVIPFTLLLILAFTGLAQVQPIDFEPNGNGADWTWTVFENDTNPPLAIVPNPDPSGINTSATVAMFTAKENGQPFAGVESMHGSDIGTFSLNSENAFVTIKVWKSVISDIGIKYATNPGASTGEIKVANTLVNQWEEITIDFTGVIDEPSSTDIDQIIVFPDFRARSADEIIYFDDISFSNGVLDVSENKDIDITSYPNPTKESWHLQSKDIMKSIEILDFKGQSIHTYNPLANKFSVNASALSSGMYIAIVKTDKASQIIKLIRK